MNHLIARTKGALGKYLLVLSDKKIFDHPQSLDNAIVYNNAAHLEEDEWFCIERFSKKEYCIDLLKKEFISSDYSQIMVPEFNQIEYLIEYRQDYFYFQKLTNRQFLKKKFFTINQQPEFHENKNIIVIESVPDAIYSKQNDILYFKSLTHIYQIFKGIEILYKEATKEETKEFLDKPFILLKNGYNVEKVKQSNRKRIALAIEELMTIPDEKLKDLFEDISEYCTELKYDSVNNHFEISNEQQLKELLYGLSERYYTTKYGLKKRLAKSIIQL